MNEDRTAILEHQRGAAKDITLEELAVGDDPRTIAAASLAAAAAVGDTTPLEVFECIDARHPTLNGRVQVRRIGSETHHPVWIPTLYRLPVREGDRLLVAHAENWDEPIAIGVLDGFAQRPRPSDPEHAALELKSDECLRVRSQDGVELLELAQGDSGPVVRLLTSDVNVEMSGTFNLEADQIRLSSRQGPVEVDASHDVVITGEVIRLN